MKRLNALKKLDQSLELFPVHTTPVTPATDFQKWGSSTDFGGGTGRGEF